MRADQMWQYTGVRRPSFADPPGPGQESVWDYPRPPKLAPDQRLVDVYLNGRKIAESTQAIRILETAGPPTFYLPPQDVRLDHLIATEDTSWCEWKGTAQYWRLNLDDAPALAVAWSYPRPNLAYDAIREYIAFYPGRVECFVGDERVRAQPGGFYGGWLTKEISGPVKGEPGTEDW